MTREELEAGHASLRKALEEEKRVVSMLEEQVAALQRNGDSLRSAIGKHLNTHKRYKEEIRVLNGHVKVWHGAWDESSKYAARLRRLYNNAYEMGRYM